MRNKENTCVEKQLGKHDCDLPSKRMFPSVILLGLEIASIHLCRHGEAASPEERGNRVACCPFLERKDLRVTCAMEDSSS